MKGDRSSSLREVNCRTMMLIPFWILDFGFWIMKVLPLGSFSNLSVATIKQNGIKPYGGCKYDNSVLAPKKTVERINSLPF